MDAIQFRKRFLYHLASTPLVSVPLGLGALTLLAGLCLGDSGAYFAFLGASGILLGLGVAATRWILDSDQLARLASNDLKAASDRDHYAYLDQLARRLKTHQDPHNDQQLQLLRRLYQRMESCGVLGDHIDLDLVPEIREKAEQLYRSCLASLERTVDLWHLAEEMSTPVFRQRVMQSREQLSAEIDRSIAHLGATLDQLQLAQAHVGSQGESLSKMREELAMGLEVAQRVEQRMEEFNQSLKGLADHAPDAG